MFEIPILYMNIITHRTETYYNNGNGESSQKWHDLTWKMTLNGWCEKTQQRQNRSEWEEKKDKKRLKLK